MGIVLDLIILAIIAISILISIKRGFVKTAIELVGFGLAVYVAFNFGPALSNVTYEKVIRNSVATTISKTITDTAEQTSAQVGDEVWEKLPGFVKKNSEKFGVSKEQMQSQINITDNLDTMTFSENITDSVVKPIATTAMNFIYGIILFILIALLTKFLAKPINKLFSISFVGSINKFLGAIIGLGKGAIFAVIFCAVISAVVVFTKSGFLIFTRENIETSTLFKLLCKINPIY